MAGAETLEQPAAAPGWQARIVRADRSVIDQSGQTSQSSQAASPIASPSTGAAVPRREISWATLIGLAGTGLLPVLGWLAVMARRRQLDETKTDGARKIEDSGLDGCAGFGSDRVGDDANAAIGVAGTDDVREPVTASTAAGPADASSTEQLYARAAMLAVATRTNIDRLPGEMPLRQVLAREFSAAVNRLDELLAAHPAVLAERARARRRLDAVVCDMHRLAEIAAGAGSSLGAGGESRPVPIGGKQVEPRDKAEACDMLGINPDVDERIARKLVEALRQSWHPDLARGEDDRRRREERIKQINVAWDLIRDKQLPTNL